MSALALCSLYVDYICMYVYIFPRIEYHPSCLVVVLVVLVIYFGTYNSWMALKDLRFKMMIPYYP